MKRILILMIVMSVLQINFAQVTKINTTINSIGIEIAEIEAYNECEVQYRKQGSANWLKSFHVDTVNINQKRIFKINLFLLEENSPYEIGITLKNTINQVNNVLPILNATTLKKPSFNYTNTIKWVSPNGSGNLYTESQPGNLTDLFNSGLVSCGTTIVLKDGKYFNFNLQLTISNPCSDLSPILLIAAPNCHPVIDGSNTEVISWTRSNTDTFLYSASIPSSSSHSNLCLLDNQALYPYPSLTPEALLGNYNLSQLSFGYDGFVRDENTIWIKTKNGTNPNNVEVKLSKENKFITIYGNNKNAYLKFKGIEFSYIAKPVLNALGASDNSYGAVVFDIRNSHHVYFDSCQFNYNSSPIVFTGQCDNIIVQNCSFKDDAGKWSHAMIKKSHDFVHTLFYTVSSSRARSSENAAIFIANVNNLIVKNCVFDGFNSAIASPVNQGLCSEVDIYNNVFYDNFDAVECDGFWTNLRVWNNEFIRPMAGISAAPPLIGPRFFYRNVFHHMQGRRNEQNDPYFIGCQPVNDYRLVGIGIKTNYGGAYTNVGNLYFFNNTFHSQDSLGFVMTNWDSEWKELYFKNNIFYHENKAPFFFHDLGGKPNFQFNSSSDDFYSNQMGGPIMIAKAVHGQFNCQEINLTSDIQSKLRQISGSTKIQINQAFQNNPQFVNTNQFNFNLSNASALINKGELIDGFYDYVGDYPDIGAKETQVLSIDDEFLNQTIMVYPNPANELLTIDISSANIAACDVVIHDLLGKMVWKSSECISDTITIDVKGFLPSMYVITFINDKGQTYHHKFIKLK